MSISSITGDWSIGSNWPYPKIFVTDYLILAVAIDGVNVKLYELTNSANVWTATEKSNLGSVSTINNIDVAGFGPYCLLTVNLGTTKTLFERNATTGVWSSKDITIIPAGNSICNFNGQLIIGSPYSTAAPWNTLPKCSIAWGDIGSTIMNPQDDIIAGFRHIPYDENGNNNVLKVLPLGNNCIVYGDAIVGIGKMELIDKYPAMSFTELKDIGVAYNYHVAGNLKKHLYIGKDNEIKLVTTDGIKSLGYKRVIETLTLADTIVSYDSITDKFFISDDVNCFILTTSGMYSTHQCTTGVTDYKGILCGFVKSNSDIKIRLKTNSFDFESQDYKTLDRIDTGISYSNKVKGKLFVKYAHNGSFISPGEIELNPQGEFTSKVTGREFKLQLESDYDSAVDFQLSSVLCHVWRS